MQILPPIDTYDGYREQPFRFNGRQLTLRYPHDCTAHTHAMSFATRLLVLDEQVSLPLYWTARVTDERLCV